MVLNSILVQGLEDLEVVIADDHSTDGFMEVVDKYKELLNIKYVAVGEHKYHCPGNTRRDGLAAAEGDWVTFIDHDDAFLPNAFNTFKASIEGNDPKIPFLFSPVHRCDYSGNNASQLDAITWLHGNFYKRQFLIDNNINFKEDLFGNEDLYFNTQVYDHLAGQGINYLTSQTPLYTWYYNPESLSNKLVEGTKAGYTEKYFGDYLIANIEPHIACREKYSWMKDHFDAALISNVRMCYLYYENAAYNYPDDPVLKEMFEASVANINKISEVTGKSFDELYDIIMKDINQYQEAYNAISTLTGKFIPVHSIKEFLNLIKESK